MEQKSLSDTAARQADYKKIEYRIKSQDILQVRNLQDIKYIANEAVAVSNGISNSPSQGQEFQVQDDGTVALPELGHIQVVGLTRGEAQKLIEDQYRKTLLKDPIIDLKIINLKVTVLGEIKSQGNYVLTKDRTTLIEVIGQAGGLTDKGNEKDIKIIRGTEQNPKVIDVDLSSLGAVNDPKTILQSGDIIYVSQNKRGARADNLQNFSTVFQPVLLLFNTALIIFTLIHK
ncbi:polysaccharide biosynthesis/export family protein [Mucilaginibacter sp. X4EP1]|uniref:polysaccharide biosynthesis/export family protein n=1 Tax=Mucilaginibacter sp. X4EP1 TaxID=2723092 RepID=UPI00216722FC|nr:polysaccharide biosynthesis/export family protein [Mucilaginibacter sp. X4EP1]MCS3811730.1 polysaccharide export outer membrane protein [Mucilaginibacter sp. X4EP1]